LHLGGVKKHQIDLKSGKEAEGVFWIDLGDYDCGNDTAITISNAGANGYVVVDGARWLSVE
jgi:hypothetical protein